MPSRSIKSLSLDELGYYKGKYETLLKFESDETLKELYSECLRLLKEEIILRESNYGKNISIGR